MRRFVLQQNIDRYEALLAQEGDARLRDWLIAETAAARRELAALSAEAAGALAGPPSLGASREQLRRDIQRVLDDSRRLMLVLEPGPGLHVVDASDAYAAATLLDRGRMGGQRMFDLFPDNPDDPLADGVSNLYTSIRRAAEIRRPDQMALQRYDVRGPDGAFVHKVWDPRNTPVFDAAGRLAFIVHEARDLTGTGEASPPLARDPLAPEND